MTAPTVPTAPLPSELETALNDIEHALDGWCPSYDYPRAELAKVRTHLLTMQRERDGHRDAEIELRNDLQKECATSRELREQLAASELTCAELRAERDAARVELNDMANRMAHHFKRAEAAERTVEGLRALGEKWRDPAYSSGCSCDQCSCRATELTTELARLEGEGK